MAGKALSMEGLAEALTKGTAEFAKNLRTDLRAAGELVATEARIRAAEHSTTIAATVKLSVLQGYTVRISAVGPLAKLYEVGNQGGGKDSPTFNHPVFAKGDRSSWTWLPKDKRQRRYPFEVPAFEAKREQVLEQMTRAIGKSFPGNG